MDPQGLPCYSQSQGSRKWQGPAGGGIQKGMRGTGPPAVASGTMPVRARERGAGAHAPVSNLSKTSAMGISTGSELGGTMSHLPGNPGFASQHIQINSNSSFP